MCERLSLSLKVRGSDVYNGVVIPHLVHLSIDDLHDNGARTVIYMLAHYSGAPFIDDIMRHNTLITRCF